MSWLLAKELDVPIPAGAVLDHPRDGRVWMSERVPDVLHWRPNIEIVNPDAAVRLLLLDVLVDNGDRHYKNVLLQPVQKDRYRLIAIDFDAAQIQRYDKHRPSVPLHPQTPEELWLRDFRLDEHQDYLSVATESLHALIESTTRVEIIAQSALEATYGVPAKTVDVALVVDYLRWRAPTAQTMAEEYWKEATK